MENEKWGGSGIEKCLFDFILEKFPRKIKMLEIGSGEISTRAFSEKYNLITIEDNSKYLNIFDCKYIYAPLENGWYSREKIKNELESGYELVFVDGPLGTHNRLNLLNNLDLFDLNVTWIFHDTYRENEIKLASEFAKFAKKNITFYKECDFWAVVE